MTIWECLDCGRTWDGPAATRVKENRRWEMRHTVVGSEIAAHVIAEGHAVVRREEPDDG